MMQPVRRRETCRLCDSARVERVVKLEPIPLSENYSYDRNDARGRARYPVDVYMCEACGHVQHLDVIDPKVLWDSYTYYSGEAKGMPEHFRSVAERALTKVEPPANALAVDIGSNDGSLLKPFKAAGLRVIGVDPATDAARRANEAGIATFCELMTPKLARRIRDEHGPAHVICAFNVFAHADDLGEMVDCVRIMLHDDGLFFFEAQYLMDIIDGVLIATIFHEHMSHHSVTPLVPFLNRHGLELIAIERAKIQHGSLIGAVQLRGGKRAIDGSVTGLLKLESERNLTQTSTLRAFEAKVQDLRATTVRLADGWRKSGANVAGYGAARSGPTLIAQLGLKGAIDFIVDDHPQKVGRFETGDGIPVVPTKELLERQPDYCVILAWVHAQKIIETNQEYLRRGGRFVVLCPQTRIVGASGDEPF
ncbi:MAG: methyltransferase domain-containing protein [Alphaproteobacteria bacterium]|nr:methyltransferase domain-containing protein [Alphaproteobacteria bacterium]